MFPSQESKYLNICPLLVMLIFLAICPLLVMLISLPLIGDTNFSHLVKIHFLIM